MTSLSLAPVRLDFIGQRPQPDSLTCQVAHAVKAGVYRDARPHVAAFVGSTHAEAPAVRGHALDGQDRFHAGPSVAGAGQLRGSCCAQKAGDESAAHASVIAREAEVRGGELLKGMNLKATTQAKPGSKVGKKDPTLPRSPLKSLGLTPSESKRRAVETLLRDEEWSRKSDVWISKTAHVSHTFVAQMRAATCNVAGSERELAKRAAVSHDFVSRLRSQLSSNDSSPPRIGADGKTRKLPAKKPKTVVTPADVKRAREALEEIDAKRDFEKAIEAEKPPTLVYTHAEKVSILGHLGRVCGIGLDGMNHLGYGG